MDETLLQVEGLTTHFYLNGGTIRAAEDVSFHLKVGGRLGLVGESGSGKSVTALSILGLITPPGKVVDGKVIFKGRNLRTLTINERRRIRGAEISMVMQDPFAALNPVEAIGTQFVEVIQSHERVSKTAALKRAQRLLAEVGLPDPSARLVDYPHHLSGGMRQRVGIALALCCEPTLLIADEPTTALDVTTQAQILELLARLTEQRGIAVILITHDLGVIAGFAQDVLVMYAGHVVEHADIERLFNQPRHPYTRGLLEAVSRPDLPRVGRIPSIPGAPPSGLNPPEGCAFHPRCGLQSGRELCRTKRPPLTMGPSGHKSACHFSDELAPPTWKGAVKTASEDTPPSGSRPVLELRNVSKHFPMTKGLVLRREVARVRALDNVSLAVREGESLGIVGESGCGKTTIAMVALHLTPPTSGQILLWGKDTTDAKAKELRSIRRDLQLIFQDPFASLNPRLRVDTIVEEPLRAHKSIARSARVAELLEQVGLLRDDGRRYPHELSGGQCQRVAIARALATQPRILLCDEPVSALDASLRGQILRLLVDLQEQLGLTCVLISHDLSMVRDVTDRVAVMYFGKLVELADTNALFTAPSHPYTAALMSAIPIPSPAIERRRERIILPGDMPSKVKPPIGCPFHTRCWKAQDICQFEEPELIEVSPSHWSACHFPEKPNDFLPLAERQGHTIGLP